MQFAQVRSTSALGSVKGKKDGRKRVRMPSPYIWRANSSSVPFKSPMVMFSSITRPSIWWKTGLWVASASSARYTRPGLMMRMGGLRVVMMRACTGLVWLRSTMLSST